MPTPQIDIYDNTQNRFESKVLVLPVHSRETRHVSFQTRLVLFLSRRVSRETRCVSRDGGNLLLSGTVYLPQVLFLSLITPCGRETTGMLHMKILKVFLYHSSEYPLQFRLKNVIFLWSPLQKQL